MPRTSRKLENFVMHAHVGDTALADYDELVTYWEEIPAQERIAEVRNDVLILPRLWRLGTALAFVVYQGEDVAPLIYNAADGSEHLIELEEGELVVERSYGILDPLSRKVVIMYNHYGAKAKDIAVLLQTFARRRDEWGFLDLEFAPIIGEDFIDEIDRFERVRVSSARFVRPNQDWTDFEDHFTQMAQDSNGRMLEVSVTASRNGDLNRNTGILGFIRRLLGTDYPNLKNASITGTREDEAAETTIWSSNFIRHRRASIDVDQTGHLNEDHVLEILSSEFPEAEPPDAGAQ